MSTSSSSKKRKAQNSLPRLPYGVSDSIDLESQANVAYQMPVDAITPADLDTSVSATLLKMAGTPSKLFSGLTSFFVDRAMSEALPLRDKTTVALGNGTSVASSATNKNATAPTGLTKKSQNSLLDDYDESPMETRLRTVQYA